MTRERFGRAGSVMSVLAMAGVFGSFLIPVPGRPAPRHEHDAILILQEWGRILLFYGSGALLIVAVIFWIISRQPR